MTYFLLFLLPPTALASVSLVYVARRALAIYRARRAARRPAEGKEFIYPLY